MLMLDNFSLDLDGPPGPKDHVTSVSQQQQVIKRLYVLQKKLYTALDN